MSGRRSKTVCSKKKRKKKSKKMFLLTSKKCWLIDEMLIPLYQHLLDGYSDQLREECLIKADIIITPQMKKESQEDNLVEYPTYQVQNSTNHEVIISLLFFLSIYPMGKPMNLSHQYFTIEWVGMNDFTHSYCGMASSSGAPQKAVKRVHVLTKLTRSTLDPLVV